VPERIDGLCLVASPEVPGQESFTTIIRTGTEWVAIVPYAFNRPGETGVYFNTERQWEGEKKDGVIKTVNRAKEAGLKVMMKPHVWVLGQGWMGDFTLNSDQKWQEWQKGYTEYLLFYATLSDSLGVEMLCIGTEMRKVVNERPEFFPQLIREIKKVYKGKITYAANWDNYQNVTFWDQVDYIGVDAYFPLSDDALPSLESLTEAWAPLADELGRYAKKENRPILFTEYGYESTTFAMAGHWKQHERTWNEEAQALGLESLYTTFWADKPWFAGGFLWKWHPTMLTMQRGEDREKYTVQDKRALETLTKWYKGSDGFPVKK
jgi:hypothetical protein